MKLHVALIYNAHPSSAPTEDHDTSGLTALRAMIRRMARALRSVGYRVSVLPLANDLFAFERALLRLRPDVVFNQYDDVVQGALYEMRCAALVQMLGFPITGSPPLALGVTRDKYMTALLMQGAGIPIPPQTEILHSGADVDRHAWQFPLIVQPSHEDAGLGLDRHSVVRSKTALRARVLELRRSFRQPVLVQRFLSGREFNVGVVGGSRLRVMPIAEVNYGGLPPGIPQIMSYAAKWLSDSEEYRGTSVVCPAQLDHAEAGQLGALAISAFRAVNGWGFGRVDIRLDEEHTPRVLEVNCNPCLDAGMALARSAEKAGITYPNLLRQVVNAALEIRHADVTLPLTRRRAPGSAAHSTLNLPVK